MSLFSKKTTGPQELQGVEISTAVNTLPIPICYGTPRVSANLIYLNGFVAVAQHQGKGGKGLLTGGKGGATSYKYYADIILAVCEGPVVNPEIKYIDGTAFQWGYYDNQTISPLDWVEGTSNQAPWSEITDRWPDQALGYIYTAYMTGLEYLLDASATVPQLQVVVPSFFGGSCPLNYSVLTLYANSYPYDGITVTLGCADADPALCFYDLLTSDQYGIGFPIAFIDTTSFFTTSFGYNPEFGDNAYSTYCQAVGLGFSVSVDTTESCNSILSRWMDLTNSAAVWTGLQLKVVPYGDTYVNTNPGYDVTNPGNVPLKYFQPYNPTLFSFDDSDYIRVDQNEDPITIERKDLADVYNTVRLSFRDRTNSFNENVAEAKDENAIELFGIRVDNMGSADEFAYIDYASISAQLRVQRNVQIRNTVTFKLSWEYCILEPMDIVFVNDENTGLSNYPVRITSVEEDENNLLTITAEEFSDGGATAPLYPRQISEAPVSYYPAAPSSPVATPLIFEPPNTLLTAQGETSPTIVIAACGATNNINDPNWGGCNIYGSIDNVTYTNLGTLTTPSTMGILSANLAAYSGSNPDNTNTLQVDLSESAGELATVTTDQAESNLSLCAIVDTSGDLELLCYTTATLVSGNTYNLTGLYRGLFGTIACSHDTNSIFARVNSLVLETILPPSFVGTELYLKLQSYNIYSLYTQDLSDCAVYTYTPTGAGVNPGNNPLLAALVAGSPIDCGQIGTPLTATLDLNAGGFGACSVNVANIDLGVI